jgi:hypothetical protein
MTTAPFAPAPPPSAPSAPAPPQGPGVFAPFPAPPTEGRGRRIGLGFGIGGAIVVLVCGGGVAAGVGLLTVMSSALNEQAHVVVGDFFDAVKAKRYGEAYNSQCADVKNQETQAQFTSRITAIDPIASYKVGDVDLTSVNLSVPVQLTYASGGGEQVMVDLGQDRDTGAFQVCGIEE